MHKQLLFSFFAIIFYQIGFSQHDKMEDYAVYRIDSCYFDAGSCNLLQTLDSNNIWEVGFPHKLFFGDAYSRENAIMTDSVDSYQENITNYFQLDVPYDAYLFPDIWIEFWHKFQFDSLKDGGYISFSFDSSTYFNAASLIESGGDTYYYLEQAESEGVMYNSSNIFGISDTGFTGETNSWLYTRIYIIFQLPRKLSSAYRITVDPPDTLHVRFYIKTDSIQTYDACWIIDNIVLGSNELGGAVENLNIEKLKTYPNPVADQLYIYAPNSSNQKFELNIKNIMGEMVLQIPEVYSIDGNLNCNISHLPSGIYVIELNNTENKYSDKIVKQ